MNTVTFRLQGMPGPFPALVERDLGPVEGLQVLEHAQLGALAGRDQPQLPALALFDLQVLVRLVGQHGPVLAGPSIIENSASGRFKKTVRPVGRWRAGP